MLKITALYATYTYQSNGKKGKNRKVHPRYRTIDEAIPLIREGVDFGQASDIVVFPGGFVTENSNQQRSLVKKIEQSLEGTRNIVLIGIDNDNCFSPHMFMNGKCQFSFDQYSYGSKKEDIIDKEHLDGTRIIVIKSRQGKEYSIGLASCGEVFRPEMQELLGKRDVVIDLAHFSFKRKRNMDAVLKTHSNFHVFTQHLRNMDADTNYASQKPILDYKISDELFARVYQID